MSYTVLARKYRPQRFSDVIGQDHVTQTLKNAIEQGRIAHGYIFSGHRGIGKTTIARILAMALNCRSSNGPVAEPCGVCESCREIREGSVGSMDIIEIDAATNRGIEDIRSLIATATSEPARDRYRIFILDEAHQVTDAAFNALLKTLEEPPEWVIFMMATTQPEDIPQTIRSRCQHFSFHAVSFQEIVGQLGRICEAEGITVEKEAVALVAEAGDGSMRDALSIMDQAIACCGNNLTVEQVRGLIGAVSSDIIADTLRAVSDNSSEKALAIADKLLVEGHSPAYFTRQFVRFLRNAIVCKVAGEHSHLLQISDDEKKRIASVAELFSEEELTRFLQIMLRTHGDVSFKAEQRFHLELGLLKLVHAQRLTPIEQLLSAAAATELKIQQPGVQAPAAMGRPAPPMASPAQRPPAPTMSSSRPPLAKPSFQSPFGANKPGLSPFERDAARKNTTEQNSIAETAAPTRPAPLSMRPLGMKPMAQPIPISRQTPPEAPTMMVGNGTPEAAPMPAPVEPTSNLDLEAIRKAVFEDMAAHRLVSGMLDEAEWSLQGSTLTLAMCEPEAALNVTFGDPLRKKVSAAATRAAGCRVKLNVVSVEKPTTTSAKPRRSTVDLQGAAANEPLIAKMQQLFGAEIRSVIDHSKE